MAPNLVSPTVETLSWLLEPDFHNPGVRYFALRDLLDQPPEASEMIAAQTAVMQNGPLPAILAAQTLPGYWVEPGAGYYPKYTGAVWQIIFLAQLGAVGRDPRVQPGCEYILDHVRSPNSGFSAGGNSGLIHCLQGNLSAALIDLGWLGDPRLNAALDWLARSIIGEGIAPAEQKNAPVRYYRSGNSVPGFACAANNHLPCAYSTPATMAARMAGVCVASRALLSVSIALTAPHALSRDPVMADYPMGYATKPSQSWFRFGYPIGYVTDALQTLEVLIALVYGGDPRLRPTLGLVLSKRDKQGCWKLEYTYNGKTWAEVKEKGKLSKWVTLRALRILRILKRCALET